MDAFYSSFLIEIWPLLVAIATAKALILQWLVAVHDQWEPSSACLCWECEAQVWVAGREAVRHEGGKGSSAPAQSLCLAGAVESPVCFKLFSQPYH